MPFIPAGGGDGGSQTLAQTLALGADAGGIEITDAHDPTAAQSLATRAYVLANVIGVPQGVYQYNVLNAPYSAAGDNSTDDATAIQAAMAAAHGAAVAGNAHVWLAPPPTAYLFKTTLTADTAVWMQGPGSQGNGPALNYDGADGTHAIIGGAGCSKPRFSGFRLVDARTSPTSGDGFHITATNGTIIEDVYALGFPGSSIYCGNTSGAVDNFTIRNVWVESLGGYGVTLDHVCESVLLQDIKGDSSGNGLGMKALIRIMGNASTGLTNIVIIGAKLENPASPSPLPDLVYIDSSFKGTVTLMGGHLGAHGGYVVNNQSAFVCINVIGSSTAGPASGLIFTAAAGTFTDSFGVITTPGTNSTLGNGTTVLNIGNVKFVGSSYAGNTL